MCTDSIWYKKLEKMYNISQYNKIFKTIYIPLVLSFNISDPFVLYYTLFDGLASFKYYIEVLAFTACHSAEIYACMVT